jgi:hypothetical protein
VKTVAYTGFMLWPGRLIALLLATVLGTLSARAQDSGYTSLKDQASMVMQLIPGEVFSGDQFTGMIQMKNTGRATWSGAGGYYLAPSVAGDWGVRRIELSKPVAPGETASFKAEFTAPEKAGEYPFQWQMRHKGTYFGQASSLAKLRVGERKLSRDDAEFVYQNVSQTMLLGETHEVALQFKNTSHTAWRAGQVSLTSPTGNSLLWAVDSVEMKPGEVVKPGEFAVFRFNVQAPMEPGHYAFQWQLHHVVDGLFGQPSNGLIIDVR